MARQTCPYFHPGFSAEFNLLGSAAFFAGLVDAVVGGGGLIQLPVLLSQYPQTAIPTLFGTNKVASIAGTSSAPGAARARSRFPGPSCCRPRWPR